MTWTFGNVTDCKGPDLIVRCYLEQMGIRTILQSVVGCINRAAEVGSGYGRVTMVLSEFANDVWGFEREKGLINIAIPLLPRIKFVNVKTLNKLPVEDGFFDFAMTFTVLQHLLTKEEVVPTINELKRIVGQGYILLVEKVRHEKGDEKPKWETIRRSIETYKELMKPFELIYTTPRVIEPTCPKKNVGMYMVFNNEIQIHS